jgi:hypothetical protein
MSQVDQLSIINRRRAKRFLFITCEKIQHIMSALNELIVAGCHWERDGRTSVSICAKNRYDGKAAIGQARRPWLIRTITFQGCASWWLKVFAGERCSDPDVASDSEPIVEPFDDSPWDLASISPSLVKIGKE